MSEWTDTIGIVQGTVGMVLNTLAWLVILRTKSLHNITNYLLVYLAVVDSILCFQSILHFAGTGILVHASSIGREIYMYCRIVYSNFLGTLTAYSSSYGLCLVTYERYIGIVHPLHYPRMMSAKKIKLIISMAWVMAFLLSSPLLFIQIAGKDSGTIDKICFHPTDSFYILTRIELVLCFVFSYLLPILFMSWAYYKIRATLKRSARQFTRDPAAALKLFKARRNMTNMLMIVMGALVVLWTPTILASLICFQSDTICISQTYYNLMTFFGLMYNLNSVINPIIYVFKYKKFRRGLLDMLCCFIGRPLRPNRIDVIALNER